MVQNIEPHGFRRNLDGACQLYIGGRWGRRSARMVVEQDNTACGHVQCPRHQLPRMNIKLINGAFHKDLVADYFVLRIEVDYHEHFMFESGKFHFCIAQHFLGGRQNFPAFYLFVKIICVKSFHQMNQQSDIFADSGDLGKLLFRGVYDTAQRTELFQQGLGDRLYIPAADSECEQKLQLFIIKQTAVSGFPVFLPQTLPVSCRKFRIKRTGSVPPHDDYPRFRRVRDSKWAVDGKRSNRPVCVIRQPCSRNRARSRASVSGPQEM